MIQEWIRWKIADLANWLFDDVCWADLCTWAAYRDPLWEILQMRGTAVHCAGEEPYCGKCQEAR